MTKLETAINGREVVNFVDGQCTLTHGSNLYRAIISAGYTPEDIGTKIDIVIGAKRRHATEGYRMAIVKHIPGGNSNE